MRFGLEAFERLQSRIEMRIKEFNEIRVVRAVCNLCVSEKLRSSSVNIHDNGFTNGAAFTTIRENMLERGIKPLVVDIAVKDVLLERVEKMLVRRVGSQT